MPKNGSLASLNPCPLNACCDTFGQCGITDEFCTISKSTTGAPGTAAPNANGCISNCGTDIVDNDDSPKEFKSIGYFEAFDQDRDCLNMDITSFDTSTYTHLHFAFATITSDYAVDTSKIKNQFEKLLNMDSKSIRRVLSFGGWSFSTDADSFPIFRKGVSDANRETFATNAAKFITDNGLDGIDFDWEYPSAPDIPGIPPGDSGDGDRYLEFLKLVRDKLPSDKTLSIAAPASYWYLKGFPIGEISDVVDYIVYITYDLHGQWDFGHKYPQPGCDGANCLWSHVNLTETTSALSMITKAGVPTTKVIVGLASYGRSFKMTDAGCTGPECHYVGPDSAAAPGRCTKTAGYIANAELQEIIDTNDSVKKLFDKDSDSNILVYNETQWVAYMDDGTKKSRTSRYQDLKMGGVVNWAVDLESFSADGDGVSRGNGTIGGQQVFYIDPLVWDEKTPSMNCDAPCYLVLPPWPLAEPSVVKPPAVTTTLDVAWPTVIHSTDDNGKVTVVTTTTRILEETTIARTTVTISDIPLANVNITAPFADGENLTFIPLPQIPYQVVTITDDPNPLKETAVSHPAVTRKVTLPPWPQITNLYLPEDSDEDSQDPGSNDDYDGVFPKFPKVTIGQGSGGPGPCKTGCGVMCQGRFCDGAGHGGADGDNWPDPSFPDPIDINPPPDPNHGPGEDDDNPDDDDNKTSTTSCSRSTVTDMYVSCATQGQSSTSCTTTSSMVEVGCDITAFTTTTGVVACSIGSDAYLEQGEDGPGAPTAYITGDNGKKVPCWSGSCGGKPSPTVPPTKTTTTTTDATTTTTTTSSTKTTSEKSTSTGPSETSLSNTSPDEDSYTCKGSSICSSFKPIKGFCDSAKARLNGDTLYGTLDSDYDTGACYTDGSNAERGCGIFIKGDGCQIKGSVMQAAYDHLHNSDVGGCKKCGAVTFSNGCVMKVDYVTGCKSSNGPAQPITISDNTTSSSPTPSLSGLFSYDSTNDWAVVGKGPDRGRSRTGTTSKATLSPTSNE